MKYQILLRILDGICNEAPEEYTKYNIDESDDDSINRARSKAFIHLYLQVKCGISGFVKRHDLITDGTQDGGLDAYYIDKENKKIFLIQSKFRSNPSNFEMKKITANDLVTMEIGRILKGEETDSRGNAFSSKILKFQAEWSQISDQAHYDYKVIILGNLAAYSDEQIRRMIDNSSYEVFDFERTYKELVFPLCAGTYFDPREINITIDLSNKEQSTLKQQIDTNLGKFPIRVLFVPTKEIGRIMSKYKNSILRYNPRNFLSLSSNKINPKIRDSILNDKANDFAIYNNGITVIADSFELTETTGTKNVGQIIMKNPQIINGGQTAYVLSQIYDNQKGDYSVFEGKEVMLKVIILTSDTELNVEFIEKISNATNQQTKIEEADRRSNDKIQTFLESNIYDEFGYFYERKKGEFYNGLVKGYLGKDAIINRYDFLKAYLAWTGDASNARRSGAETLFKERKFKEILKNVSDIKRMIFAYKLFINVGKIKPGIRKLFGPTMKYGKMAIIAALGVIGISEDEITLDTIDDLAIRRIEEIALFWDDFIGYATANPNNSDYLYNGELLDQDFYFKGRTVNEDIKVFFGKI